MSRRAQKRKRLKKKRCKWSGNWFQPGRPDQRFENTAARQAYNNEQTRKAVQAFRKEGDA